MKTRKDRLFFHPDSVVKQIQAQMRDDFNRSFLAVQAGTVDIKKQYAKLQLEGFKKKYLSENLPADSLRDEAFSKFFENAIRLSFNEFAVVDNIRDATCDVQRILCHARSFLSYVLHDITLEELFMAAKHSTGTTLGLKYWFTNIEDKFTFPITGTQTAIDLFQLYLEFDPRLHDAIHSLNQYSDKPMYEVVTGARITSVHKDDRGDRVIAVEPTLGMFFQKALETILRDRLLPYVDLSVAQENHGFLAFVASLLRNQGTIDFKSASDSVLTEVLSGLFPPKWYCVLDSVRSKELTYKGKPVKVPLFSTMGNATTFPVETLLFYSLLYGVTQKHRKYSAIYDDSFKRTFSVFGDDCIVATEDCDSFIEVASFCGLLVNDEKSYYKDDYFRESCGFDYYQGHNMRPFQIKAPTGTKKADLKPWLNIIVNSIIKKYITYFGAETYCYQAIFDLLFGFYSRYKLKVDLVPDYFPDDAGVKLLGDVRFLRIIPRKLLSKVLVNKHGLCRFSYTSWEFPNTVGFGDIRYWNSLKFPVQAPFDGHERSIGFNSVPLPLQGENTDVWVSKRKGWYRSRVAEGFMPQSFFTFTFFSVWKT